MHKLPPELHAKIVSGDWEAWHSLWVSDIENMVEFMVVQYFKIPEETADIKSDLQIKLFERFHQYDVEQGISPWVITTSRNHCINEIKKRHKTYAMVDCDNYLHRGKQQDNVRETEKSFDDINIQASSKGGGVKVISNDYPYPSDPALFSDCVRSKIYTEQCMKHIRTSMAKLPEKIREVMELRFSGHSYNKIAEITELPQGTVMSHIHAGKNYIRHDLVSIAPELASLVSAKYSYDKNKSKSKNPKSPSKMGEVQCKSL